MLTRIQGDRRSPLHGTFATLQRRKRRNCFYSRFHLSAENMPSRFLRGRRRRCGGRHAPRSFPNNLKRCTKHEWRRGEREKKEEVLSLSSGRFHWNIVPHFPSISSSPVVVAASSKSLFQRGSASEATCFNFLLMFTVHIGFRRRNYGSRRQRRLRRFRFQIRNERTSSGGRKIKRNRECSAYEAAIQREFLLCASGR